MVVVAPERYQIDFKQGDALDLQADCNKGSGSYTLSDGALALSPIATTKMGCGDDSQDGEFVSQLGNARSLTLADGRLSIELADGRGTMHFARDPKSTLTQ